MNYKIVKMCIVCIIALYTSQSVFANVSTSTGTDAAGSAIYVAGNPDFYPIEYYNNETEQYEGVMPRMLRDISERTGIDFVYLHTADTTQAELAENLQAEIVSAYVTDGGEGYAKDKITALSYLYKGKTMNIGWAFTEITDQSLVETIKSETAKITEEEITGYFVAESQSVPQDKRGIVYASVLCCILLAVLIVLALLKLKSAKRLILENQTIDADTGIGNLVYFEHCFDSMISDLSRSLYYIAYIIIDSNYLQVYHSESTFMDAVKYTAGVLRSYVKHNEIAARITENGFAFAFQRTNTAEAKQMIEEITAKLNLYIEAEDSDSRPFFHAAVYNLKQTDRNCELLLFNLRKTCSKLIGTENQLVLCDEGMMNSALEEKQLLESISNGFKNREFKMYLQFIVDNKTKQIVSAEALSRWDNADKGIVSPGKYIASMESSGLITKLDYHMFEMTCRQLHKWKDTRLGAVTISCNFTRITISEDDFVENIKEIASRYIFNKSQLIIEITEDAIEKNRANAMDNVRKCKEMGFKIALDDMGTGYTSLINLCEYPIDIVKIDRDILLKTDKKNGRDLFFGIIALAHSLNLKVVCEGVETEQQDALVHDSECDYVQGWYYSRVFPEREGEAFAKQYCDKLSCK